MNKPPEYYLGQLDVIKEDLKTLPDKNTDEYTDILNQDYETLSQMNSTLINIIDSIENETSQTNVPLYDEYKDLYLTYYFTNISLLLGICLLIRYILYYIYI